MRDIVVLVADPAIIDGPGDVTQVPEGSTLMVCSSPIIPGQTGLIRCGIY
jgi:hypothetical protein